MTCYSSMYFWNKLSVFSIFVRIIVTCTSEVRQIIWERDNALQDFDYLWLTTVHSRLRCSVTCTDDERCSAFFFNESVKSCIAYQYPLESILGTVSPEQGSYYFKPDNCPADYSYSRKANICIKVFITGASGKSEVQQKCEDDTVGSGLVTIRNQDQQDFVVNEIKRQTSVILPFYVDGTDELVEGTYIAKDGQIMTFFDWAFNKPDSAATYEHCLQLNHESPYKLTHCDCSKYSSYICEIVLTL